MVREKLVIDKGAGRLKGLLNGSQSQRSSENDYYPQMGIEGSQIQKASRLPMLQPVVKVEASVPANNPMIPTVPPPET